MTSPLPSTPDVAILPPILTLFCETCRTRCFLHGVSIEDATSGRARFGEALAKSGQLVECFHFVAKHDGHPIAAHVMPYEAKA